jgi:hypothetical protein
MAREYFQLVTSPIKLAPIVNKQKTTKNPDLFRSKFTRVVSCLGIKINQKFSEVGGGALVRHLCNDTWETYKRTTRRQKESSINNKSSRVVCVVGLTCCNQCHRRREEKKKKWSVDSGGSRLGPPCQRDWNSWPSLESDVGNWSHLKSMNDRHLNNREGKRQLWQWWSNNTQSMGEEE